jgi:hypothetical protein
MMTLQQTLTIPKATTHLSVDLSEPVPAGTIDVIVFSHAAATDTHEDWRSLYGLCKESGDTLDAFLERHYDERRLERESEEHELRERV